MVGREDDAPAAAGVPRYHLACRLPATARQPAV